MWWIFGGQIFCRFYPRKMGLNFVTENFTTIFTARKEICHLELALDHPCLNFCRTRPFATKFPQRERHLYHCMCKTIRHRWRINSQCLIRSSLYEIQWPNSNSEFQGRVRRRIRIRSCCDRGAPRRACRKIVLPNLSSGNPDFHNLA